MPSRRDVIRSAGTAVVAGSAIAVLSGSAAADHFDAQRSDASISYDKTLLDRYRPRLVLPTSARDKLIGIYGWVVSSAEFDTEIACYWASYTHQDGWLGNRDSHWGDHEPVQVIYDATTGSVRRIRASVYHWLKGETTPSAAAMYDDTHVKLRVIEPWHQYTAPKPSDLGAFYDVNDLTAVFQDWLDNGLEGDLEPGTSTNPWTMANRTSWWRDAVAGFSIDETIVTGSRELGVGEEGNLSA